MLGSFIFSFFIMYQGRKAILATATLAVMLCMGMQAVVAVSAVSSTDIEQAADYLKQAGIIQGDDGTGNLRLDDNINRAELMKIVVAASTDGAVEAEFKDCFPDVKREWFARFICWATTKKYVGGYPDGTFAAAKPVNTAEAIKMISEVFHLDFGKVRAQANASIWYDVYVKNAMRQGIVDGELSGEILARPATRGEVFTYLYRAMLLSDKGEEKYSRDGFKGFSGESLKERLAEKQTRELTAPEAALLSVLDAHKMRGYADMSASSDVKFTLSLPNPKTQPLELDVHVKKQMKTDSDAKTMDRFIADGQFTVNVKGFSSSNVSGTVTGDMTIMMDKQYYYIRLNSVSASNIASPNPNAQYGIQATFDDLTAKAGTWYRISKASVDGEVGFFQVVSGNKMLPGAVVDMLDRVMKTKAAGLIEVTTPNAEDTSVLRVSLNKERFPRLLEGLLLSKDLKGNRYALRGVLHMMDEELIKMAGNFSLTLTYDAQDKLVRSLTFALGNSSVTTANGTLSVSAGNTSEFAYDSVEMTFPQTVKDITYIPFIMLPKE